MRRSAYQRTLIVHFLTGKPDWRTRMVPHIACGKGGRRTTREPEQVTCRVCRTMLDAGLLAETAVRP